MTVHGIDANYYTVIDLAKMTGFYSKILGKPAMEQPRLAEWSFPDRRPQRQRGVCGGRH